MPSTGQLNPSVNSPLHGALNSSFTWPSPGPDILANSPALTQPSPLSTNGHISFFRHSDSDRSAGRSSRRPQEVEGAEHDHLTREGRMTLDERMTRMEYANRAAVTTPRDIFPANHPPSLMRMGTRHGGRRYGREGPDLRVGVVEEAAVRGRETWARRDRGSESDLLMGSATHTPTPTKVAHGQSQGLARQNLYSPSHGHSYSTATITAATPPPTAIDTRHRSRERQNRDQARHSNRMSKSCDQTRCWHHAHHPPSTRSSWRQC
ncbi:hypothetical protein HGRIS_001030 [Hohenbuehelia grisea]|uniref:Uncharacterized protein n=1 Tax=Hohenbuehelia grisea TaxID=104357 RepID=A0ABR3JN17_9AGAR